MFSSSSHSASSVICFRRGINAENVTYFSTDRMSVQSASRASALLIDSNTSKSGHGYDVLFSCPQTTPGVKLSPVQELLLSFSVKTPTVFGN